MKNAKLVTTSPLKAADRVPSVLLVTLVHSQTRPPIHAPQAGSPKLDLCPVLRLTLLLADAEPLASSRILVQTSAWTVLRASNAPQPSPYPFLARLDTTLTVRTRPRALFALRERSAPLLVARLSTVLMVNGQRLARLTAILFQLVCKV